MPRKIILMVIAVLLLMPVYVHAYRGHGSVVDVSVVSDYGEIYPLYRTYPRSLQAAKYFYLEAVKGEKYNIRVSNLSGRRVGVVIAVDGRNIISGQKSGLSRNERMYIIAPNGLNTFEGWRTAMDRTNRFYFTTQSNSYAERVFADGSAMGTIAVAVFYEKLPDVSLHYKQRLRAQEAPAGAEPESKSADRMKKSEQAGTGFGETTYSPAHVVQFNPEYSPAEKLIYKYEWRSELCRKRIIGCNQKNRFWPDNQGFAPVPRDFGG